MPGAIAAALIVAAGFQVLAKNSAAGAVVLGEHPGVAGVSEGVIQPEVLHVNTAKTWRGGEQQIVYLLRGLRDRGLRAEAVCRPGSPLARRARSIGATVHEVPVRFELDPLAALRLARLARRRGFNILHAHTAHAHGIVWVARHLFPAGYRVVVHRRTEFPPGKGAFGLARIKYRFGVEAYIAISNRMKEILVEAGIKPWRVFPVRSATDPQRFVHTQPDFELRRKLGIPHDACVVGNIAYLVPHKDHANLLKAASIAIREVPNLWVVIVGTGPLRERIVRRAQELGLSERLVLTGFRNDIPQLIRMFDVFALSSSEEGICSTLLDVMASGRPIVATDAAGVREAVLDSESGIVVPVKDPEALAAGVVRMVRNPQMARRMVAKGRERALRHFNVDALTEKTLAVYRRVLAGQVGPGHPVPPEP